jgi:small-conductance mechanosensitive channel
MPFSPLPTLSKRTRSLVAAGILCLFSIYLYDNHFQAEWLHLQRFRWTLGNLRDTLLVIGNVYIFSGISNFIIRQQDQKMKRRLYLQKLINTIALIITALSILFIWVENQQTFSTYFGFVTIAIAVSFQDLFRNLVGSIIINTTRNIEIGDTIEVDEHIGKVIDVGFLYTTLLENQSWDDVSQVNNREIKLPNQVFSSQVSKSFDMRDDYIWDELKIILDEPQKAGEIETETYLIVKSELADHLQPSKQFLKKLYGSYIGAPTKSWSIRIYFDIKESDVIMTIRYLAHHSEVRDIRSKLIIKLAKQFLKSANPGISDKKIQPI